MDWFEILKWVKKSCPTQDHTFKVSDIQEAFKFKDAEKTDAYHIASGWVGKLVRWNYVERVGSEKNGDHKKIAIYGLTQKGRQAKNTSSTAHMSAPSEEELSDFDKLRDAVRDFETARTERIASTGKKSFKEAFEKEEQAFVDLIALCNVFDREEYGVNE